MLFDDDDDDDDDAGGVGGGAVVAADEDDGDGDDNDDGEKEDDGGAGALAPFVVFVAIADDCHADVASWLGSKPPIVDVVAGRICSTRSRGLAHHTDYFSSTFGDLINEGSVKISFILDNSA